MLNLNTNINLKYPRHEKFETLIFKGLYWSTWQNLWEWLSLQSRSCHGVTVYKELGLGKKGLEWNYSLSDSMIYPLILTHSFSSNKLKMFPKIPKALNYHLIWFRILSNMYSNFVPFKKWFISLFLIFLGYSQSFFIQIQFANINYLDMMRSIIELLYQFCLLNLSLYHSCGFFKKMYLPYPRQ